MTTLASPSAVRDPRASKALCLSSGLAAALLCAACAQVQVEPETLARTEAPVVAAQEPRNEEPVAPSPPEKTPEPPAPPADVWERIRGGFQMTNLNGQLVQDWEQYYAHRPDYVERMIERASHFLYHIMEEVDRRKMPSEIALLPMIESAFNPRAYSRAHASGMWQFIPSTGRLYGLRQNYWYDGRRDVLAATGAALDYLEKLHGMFNDWNLALAAYNWGEGAVGRAIARNQARGLPTDYESLKMPAETRNYLPKLQAVKNIVATPQQYGLALASVPNRPYFATVTTRQHIDVKLAASLAEISLEEFRFLNPAHNKPVIKADGSETIVLPIDKIAVFERNLEAHDQPLVTWQAYTVKRSDNPAAIAAKHGITLAQLKEANGITGNRNIVAGQTILVPLTGSAEPHLPDLPAPRITQTNYHSQKYRCTMKTADGQRRVVPCAPSKPAAAKAAKKPAVKM